jgi:hypothetical protein
MIRIEQNKPTIGAIGKTRGVYQTSVITYNQAGLTYNDATTVYGGSDTSSDAMTTLLTIDTGKP